MYNPLNKATIVPDERQSPPPRQEERKPTESKKFMETISISSHEINEFINDNITDLIFRVRKGFEEYQVLFPVPSHLNNKNREKNIRNRIKLLKLAIYQEDEVKEEINVAKIRKGAEML